MKAQLWLAFIHAEAAVRALSSGVTHVLAVLYHLQKAMGIWKATR